MNMEELRARIDQADERLLRAFEERMDIAVQIAAYKQANGLPALDSGRERAKLAQVSALAGERSRPYVGALYSLLFELSRTEQNKLLRPHCPLEEEILHAVEGTERLFPPSAAVACQGVEGAYSQLACEKVFKMPDILYFKSFDAVFAAIDKGMCRYGILPLENSTAGSVTKIYDLMMEYRFHIVRSVRLRVSHSLLARRGTAMKDVREIVSHPQAIGQCARFLASLGDVKVTPAENTAAAAKMAAESGRSDLAVLASPQCAALYSLETLQENVQDSEGNYTRFICIAKDLEIYPGSDRTSIMMVLPHRPGSLYKVLSRFYALGINLLKLESRPLPGRDFEFMFYFDLETSVYSPEFARMICELEEMAQQFRYLGSYLEIV